MDARQVFVGKASQRLEGVCVGSQPSRTSPLGLRATRLEWFEQSGRRRGRRAHGRHGVCALSCGRGTLRTKVVAPKVVRESKNVQGKGHKPGCACAARSVDLPGHRALQKGSDWSKTMDHIVYQYRDKSSCWWSREKSGTLLIFPIFYIYKWHYDQNTSRLARESSKGGGRKS